MDFNAVVDQLEVIEEKHGSICNVPDDNPDVIKLHKLVGFKGYQKHRRALDYDPNKVLSYLKKGYSPRNTARALGLTLGQVAHLQHEHHIKGFVDFWWVATKKGQPRYYSSGLSYFAKMANRDITNTKAAQKIAAELGFKIHRTHVVWGTLPEGAYYIHSKLKRFHQKHGINSYVKEDD